MIKAVIFDLDGTLVDTEMLWVKALENYIASMGEPLPHVEVRDIVFGRAWKDIYESVVELCPSVNGTIEEVGSELAWRFEEQVDGVDVRIHDSIECLHQLAADYPICIVSGSGRREIQNAVDLMGIGDCISFFLGTEDYSPGKPAPAGFLKAANRFGVAPENCLVFEDSYAGVSSAKAAGMRCIALKRANVPDQDLSGADAIVDSLSKFKVSDLV